MNRTPDFDHGLLPSDDEFERMKGNVLDRLDLAESAPDAVSPHRSTERGASGRRPIISVPRQGASNGPPTRRLSRRRTLGLASGLVALALVATTFALPRVAREVEMASQGEARQAVFGQLERRRGTTDDAVFVERTLAELLPNTLFSIDGQEPAQLAAGIVVGRVTAVSEGRAYVIEGDDAESGTVVPFDSEDALWRTITVTVEIAQGWGDVPGESTISFGVGIGDEDPQSTMDNYSKLGKIIVVLDPPGIYDYDPALYQVRLSGIGTVSDGGAISFPAMAEREQEFLRGTPTLSDLAKAATEDDQIIAVSSDDNYARE